MALLVIHFQGYFGFFRLGRQHPGRVIEQVVGDAVPATHMPSHSGKPATTKWAVKTSKDSFHRRLPGHPQPAPLADAIHSVTAKCDCNRMPTTTQSAGQALSTSGDWSPCSELKALPHKVRCLCLQTSPECLCDQQLFGDAEQQGQMKAKKHDAAALHSSALTPLRHQAA